MNAIAKKPNRDLVKTTCKSVENAPFVVGDEVLARWHDGLYYLACVKSINERKPKCCVTYEDGSDGWVSFRNIRTECPYGDILCTVCESKESIANNEIIICDRCNHGYHQYCHVPVLEDQEIKITGSWLCRTCVFSKAARSDGALKTGTEAEALMSMKQILPYDIYSLHWDGRHHANNEDTYCYCGGPGIYYYKMLQCFDCKQWFHEACLQCLDFPLLLGDRFYYFLCTLCNKGNEYLKRLQMKWLDIAILVFFNLTLKYDKKRFVKHEIKDFVNENWDELQTGELRTTTPEDQVQKIVEIVTQKKKKFRCYSFNGFNCWSLIGCSSPLPTKSNYFREHCLRINAENHYSFLDCNGNYLPGTQDNFTKSFEGKGLPHQEMVHADSTGNTSEDLNESQSPPFPSPSMFKYFLPSSTRHGQETNSTVESGSSTEPYGSSTEPYGICKYPEDEPKPGQKRGLASDQDEGIGDGFLDYMGDDITSYDGAVGRITCGEKYAIHGRRVAKNGRTEYLVEWSGSTPNDH